MGREIIPLQSVKNKLVSQRVTSVNETQVSNYPSVIYTDSYPSITCDCQKVERIYYGNNCCSTSGCASNSCV